MKLYKTSFNLLVLVILLGLSSSVRSQDDDADAADDEALAAAIESALSPSGSSSGSGDSDSASAAQAPASIDLFGDVVGSSSGSSSSSSGSGSADSSLNDISPAVGASPIAAFGSSRPGIPRLGSGYLLEQFRNFNLPGRLRTLTERVRNLRLGERARQFRAGLVINPDSLAYRTGRRFTLTLQGLGKRVRDWGERVRARQGQGQGVRPNEIPERR